MVVFFQCSDVHEDAIVFGEPLKFSETSRDVQPPPKGRFPPHESTGNFKAADSPIQLDQEILSTHGPSSSKPPPLSMQINSVDMEQASTALQKVSNNCTTSACVNKDDAKNYCKVKEREGPPERLAVNLAKDVLSSGLDLIALPLKITKLFTFWMPILSSRLMGCCSSFIVPGWSSSLHSSHSFLNITSKMISLITTIVWVENNGKVMVYHLGNITTVDDLFLAPILRAATALGFETYRVWAAQVLGQTWTSSLADLTSEPKENAAEFIALARSCDVNSGVKRALYELARTRGIGLHGNDVLGQSGLEQISHADQKCVVLIRELSVTTWSEIAVRIGMSPCQGDKVNTSTPWNKKAKFSVSQETCSFEYGIQDAWNKRIHDSGLYTKFLFDPVCGAQALIDIPWGEEGWCSHCIRSKRATWKKIREKLWSDMDKWIPGHE
ncbi:hypothetical protein DFJ58DRAFT_771549 [Suillus subalutaceus]|uniref:uncharacterized protein n=1 Tax=Suillus subalutaceus TaxID=48586 RepID=UPI001B86D006|nr:uncharacterized protein DFJ58DRAFT_771549 [Suillus subalutaceus]KAG1865553.1 hypothetical protein DFJ58DRAFT_771549 [Suillus subalutaceus]